MYLDLFAHLVSERCRNFYAYFQSDLHDAINWSLERLSAVSCANASGLPA
jgi:hypothetical protein